MKHTIYLAGGCYWGAEKYLSNITGVLETEVGFANGHVEAPAYVQVKKGDTANAEKYTNLFKGWLEANRPGATDIDGQGFAVTAE